MSVRTQDLIARYKRQSTTSLTSTAYFLDSLKRLKKGSLVVLLWDMEFTSDSEQVNPASFRFQCLDKHIDENIAIRKPRGRICDDFLDSLTYY